MVYLAFQGMALNPANYSSSSLSSTATDSDYASFDLSTPSSSTSSLPLTPAPKTTQTSSYPDSTDPYPHSIKLELTEPHTYGTPPTPTSIHNTIPKKVKVPRPPNSFIIYRKEHSAGYSKITAAELSKILGEQWAKEPPERRAYYARLAKAAEKEHALKFPYYKFTPAKRGTGRRAKTMRAAASAEQKTTPVSPKPRPYKPSPLSALAPAPFSPSISPPFTSSHLAIPMSSMQSSLGHGVSQSSAFSYTMTTAKNNTQVSVHVARPADAEDYHFHHSKSNQSSAQRPKPRHAAAPLRPRPSTPTTQGSPSCHAAPGPLNLDMFPSLNFGFSHPLPLSQSVSSSSSLSPPGLPASSLLFDPIIPTNWQWTPPTPATPSQFTMPAMTPSAYPGQPQSSPMPPNQEMTQLVNLPAFDYFALQDPGRPATFAMNWPYMSPPITGTPLPIPGDVTATANSDDCTPTSYQWGVGAPVPASAWPSPEAIYGADLLTPVSPEFCASMNIPIPSAKQQHHHLHHLHNYHNQMMPLNGTAAGFAASMMVEQDMSISPVLSSCSSSYSSLYSPIERQAHFSKPFFAGDLALDYMTSKTPTTAACSAAAGTSDVILLDMEPKNTKLAAAAPAAVSQARSSSPISYKTFV
ncbi:hypothetical protein F5H01DRAFT_343867 [Linnemannia elongata]|nr:hypothetical protein F5H01DRAFT_343867 [Linnemannia elongata]